jgi:hypothetical protein
MDLDRIRLDLCCRAYEKAATMKMSSDPAIHRRREQQIIQHVERLLADDRLRVETIFGRRPITAFIRDVVRNDHAMDLKRLMMEMNIPDRELMSRMPIGQLLDVSLKRTHWFVFNQTVARIRVACFSPVRALLSGAELQPMNADDVTKALAAMPPPLGPSPATVVLVSTSGFSRDAVDLVQNRPGRTVILLEPNAAGGWTANGPERAKPIIDLFDPEVEGDKRDRVLELIKESQIDLLGSGIAADKLAAKSQLSEAFVESVVKEYARANPGLSAKKLDGRVVLFREGTGSLITAGLGSGGSMGLVDKVRTLFSGKGENEKKIAFLSERKTALSQQRDRAYDEMSSLETQEAKLKQQFKDAAGAITKRRVTSQMLQLRKDLERRQQLLSMLNQQVDVVSTHLHNLGLVQQGSAAKLPNTDEITEDAVKAEEILAQLEADSELAGSIGQIATASMSDEEKALFEELEKETGDPVEAEPPMKMETKVAELAPREPATYTPPVREPQVEQSAPSPARRAKPEAG